MFTKNDIKYRSIITIDCSSEKEICMRNGELFLIDKNTNKPLTKFPFQKILIIYIIGNATITTPFIDKCKKNNVALCVTRFNLRPVFWWGEAAEGNFLLRQHQYALDRNDISIAKFLVKNKILNQQKLLLKIRSKDAQIVESISFLGKAVDSINSVRDYEILMGIEGRASKSFFCAYFKDFNWKARNPRLRCDEINLLLDIGYTLLFNYIEAFVRLFGFDLYIGVYHRLWFRRKSLICDLMEPFRCIIEAQIRKSLNKSQFNLDDFEFKNNEYELKKEKRMDYYKVFYTALIEYKLDIFSFVQSYYRKFMGRKSIEEYRMFSI